MKTNPRFSDEAPILQLKDGESVNAATRSDIVRARSFVEPFISGIAMMTGEDTLEHADAVVQILDDLHSSESLQTAAYLIYAVEHMQRPKEVIEKAFGSSLANLVIDTDRLVQVQRAARLGNKVQGNAIAAQTERARKMLLAFSRDLRGVMLRLTSRLQTMRYACAHKVELPKSLSEESLYVFAPLASRLGIWQLKWQLEDLAFRCLQPDAYRDIAQKLDESRTEREAYIEALTVYLMQGLKEQGIDAKVTGRPKHIYSIWKKMNGKSLDFSELYDIRAFRIIVSTVPDCYTALAWINERFEQISSEFDDYIAKPKVNGYQSLHCIVKDNSKAGHGKPLEIQIRTQEMHDRAESGVAAHWVYKEAGVKGYSGVVANSGYDARIAMLRQLLAWERDLSHQAVESGETSLFDDRIYVLTPMATLMELPQGSTPLDFAYLVHTDLGHRCRGAKVNGVMVPLDTPLQNGQTVEIITVKEGGPSRDWLNPEAGYLVSPRAKAKVRAWFNALLAEETISRGREQVEKLLQREGKTALKLDDLASKLGFKTADALFELVGKDEYSLRNIELFFKPELKGEMTEEEVVLLNASRKIRSKTAGKGGVLVVGMDSLMTQLAKCCKPAPPDLLLGYVTRGKGVSIHRQDCTNVAELQRREPERIIEVEWEHSRDGINGGFARYPVDIEVRAIDRQGLLRDISEVLVKENINVIGMNVQSARSRRNEGINCTIYTVEVPDTQRLDHALRLVAAVSGVRSAQRI